MVSRKNNTASLLCLIIMVELACVVSHTSGGAIVSRTSGRASVWCLVHVVELACGVLYKWRS